MSDKTPDPAPTEAPRFAAYDEGALRFVGGVHASRDAARDAGKATGAKRVTVREV